MTDRLKDKIAIISGGESGVGAAVAARFHGQGAVVVLADRAVSAAALARDGSIARHPPAARAAWNRVAPIGRYGEPEEVADAALFLASGESSHVTGHVLDVDGGFMAGGMTPGKP